MVLYSQHAQSSTGPECLKGGKQFKWLKMTTIIFLNGHGQKMTGASFLPSLIRRKVGKRYLSVTLHTQLGKEELTKLPNAMKSQKTAVSIHCTFKRIIK